MAQKTTLLKDFAGGQGAGAGNYISYADDLDTNFAAIEAMLFQVIDELSANLANSSLFVFDMLRADDPGGTVESNGVIGEHSLRVTVNGGDASQLLVEVGTALLNSRRVVSNSQITLQGSDGLLGSGASNPITVFLASDGTVDVDLTANLPAGTLALASGNWDGTTDSFSAIVQEAPIFFDGDDYAGQLDRAAKGAGPAFAAKDFRTAWARIDAIERMLAGVATDAEGDPIGTPELASLLLDALRFDVDGSAGTPVLRRESDPNTGLYFPAVDELGLVAGGVPTRLGSAFLRLGFAGAVGAPALARQADPDTGIYFPGADEMAFTVGGAQAWHGDPSGRISLPLQARAIVRRNAVQTLAASTALAQISFDVEDEDIGNFIAVTAAVLTAPVAGSYLIEALVTFLESTNVGGTANAGERQVSLTSAAGTPFAENGGSSRVAACPAGDTIVPVVLRVQLSASATVRLEALQTNAGATNGTMDVTGRLSIQKIA